MFIVAFQDIKFNISHIKITQHPGVLGTEHDKYIQFDSPTNKKFTYYLRTTYFYYFLTTRFLQYTDNKY
jgi:hypothetical protein